MLAGRLDMATTALRVAVLSLFAALSGTGSTTAKRKRLLCTRTDESVPG